MEKDRRVILIDRGAQMKKLNEASQRKRRQLERIVEMQVEILSEMAQSDSEMRRLLKDLWKKTG